MTRDLDAGGERGTGVLMRLVGGQVSFADGAADSELWGFYRELFERLSAEVLPGVDGLTRHVGFRSTARDGERVLFLGLEVPGLEDIPEGMVGWELSGDSWSVWERVDGRPRVVARQAIGWTWLHEPGDGAALPVGEFETLAEEASGRRAFRICAHAYVGPRERVVDDTIRLVDYDPSWPERFEEFAGWLREALGAETALRIAHYGSTAIPGMPAKPVIDVLVEVPSFGEARRCGLGALNRPEWECWWCIDHLIFIRRDGVSGQRTHHVHMVPRGHREWESLVFCEYLRTHAEDARRYAELKYRLAELFGDDRERYTEEKSAFVREILARASGGA